MKSPAARSIPYAPPGTPERDYLTEEAARRIEQARMNLMLSAPFFGMLVMHLRTILLWPEEWPRGVPTTAFTDGVRICFNPMFALYRDPSELCAVLCHEVLHAALDHIGRLQDHDPFLWNLAADYVVNEILLDFIRTTDTRAAQWKLPQGALVDSRYRGKSGEQVYEILRRNGLHGHRPTPSNDARAGGGMPMEEVVRQVAEGHTVFVRSLEDPRSLPDRTRDVQGDLWAERLVRAGQMAGFRGTLPAAIRHAIEGLLAPVVDWRVVLQAFVEQVARADYTFQRPNRNMLYLDLFLPSLSSPELREVVAIVDDSGSCQHAIKPFLSECAGIFDAFPGCLMHLVSCDTEPEHVLDWEPGDPEPGFDAKIELHGGGGTSFVKPFEMIREKAWEPSVVLYLTDLDGIMPEPELEPECAVLWVVNNTRHSQEELPFGNLCCYHELSEPEMWR